MHIALIIADLGGGGAETVVLSLAGGLIDRGHRVDIVLFQTKIYRQVPKGARLIVVGKQVG